MTDRPTGPATAKRTVCLGCGGYVRHADWCPIQAEEKRMADVRAAERARIFAALPAALHRQHGHPLPGACDVCRREATALVAAIRQRIAERQP